jgi:starch synthase
MKVLFLTAEAAPFTKVGGLGDVAGSLPQALRAAGVDVRVALPLHGRARARLTAPLTKVADVEVPHPAGAIRGQLLETSHAGVPFYFVASPLLAEDGPVYHLDTGWDAHRFAFFSIAALRGARAAGFVPDVVHANDWHTAPAIPATARARFEDPAFGGTRTVLTVHNLPYVGWGAGAAMRAFGLVPGQVPFVPPEGRELPLPIGLSLADRITTVSPGYAREILGPEHGSGLDGLLRERRDVLTGILNGLDVALWDPARDPALAVRYDVERLEERTAGKRALQEELGLPLRDVPLLGVISRFSGQKGIDLVPDAIRSLEAEHAFQLVILGTGDHELEDRIVRMAGHMGERVRARIAFDDALSRRIYAGADFLLVPSRYEPCGLAQMIAMRYGCVPIARDTGGLSDTVRDLDIHDAPTGFLFPEPTARSLAFALRRALATHAHPERFRTLQTSGMSQDFSWTHAANSYARLYDDLARSP